MIPAAYCRQMARYNQWQNDSLMTAAETLDDAALRAERGAFFGSIFGTFNHVLWGDGMWMSRFAGWPPPGGRIADSPRLTTDWATFRDRRQDADQRLIDWADGLDDAALKGELSWHSGALGQNVARPRALLVAHMFNHQTHHRGQIHAMLTAAGARPGDTDLFVMPGL